MSLLVWLPLNGDFNNYGISDELTQTSTNTPVWRDEGKIGAHSLDLGAATTFSSDALAGVHNFSMMCWCKIEDNTANTTKNWLKIFLLQDATASGTTGTIRFESCYGSSARFASWHNNGTNATYAGNKVFASRTEWGKWHHLCVVFGDTYADTYFDGTLISHLTGNRGDGHLTGATIQLGATNQKGCMNDVRIYDTALSAAEVKEIAQGLMLHYKLDDITNGIIDSSGYGYHGTITGTLTTETTTARYSNCLYSASGTNNYIDTPVLGLPTDAVTLNIWFKSSNTTPTSDWHMVVDSIGTTTAQRQYYEMAVNKTGYFRGGLYINDTRHTRDSSILTGCDGNWHMLTLSYDGGTEKIYYDGALANSKSVAISTGLHTNLALRLFKDGYSTYACVEASLSDFRIYATALSTDAIRQLHEVGAKVDKDGKLHTFEFSEPDTSANRTINTISFTSSFSSTTSTITIFTYSTYVNGKRTTQSISRNHTVYTSNNFYLPTQTSYTFNWPQIRGNTYTGYYTVSSSSNSKTTYYYKYGYLYIYLLFYNENNTQIKKITLASNGTSVTNGRSSFSAEQVSLSAGSKTIYINQNELGAYCKFQVDYQVASPSGTGNFIIKRATTRPQLKKTGVFINEHIAEQDEVIEIDKYGTLSFKDFIEI